MKIEAGAYVTPNVRLLRLLGEGGMGAVWVAEHLSLGTEVAVKFLSGDYAEDKTARARFTREAGAASRVKSSHVVKIYDHGITDTQVPFIVMELLDGTDLAHRIQQEQKLNPTFVIAIVSQLCKALERAHEVGVVHRDIKPENIFLGSEGGDVFVKLLDFGVAKTERIVTQKTTGGRHSTMAGEALGTPFYMSPEQFKSSKDIDFRSDLWSVGIVVYEALTGKLPFEGETVSAVAIAVNDGVTTPPSELEPSLPKALDAWFAKACARKPDDRFASARELSDGLRAAFSMPVDSRASIPDVSSSGRVIIRSPNATASTWNDTTAQADQPAALRDTSFATSGGRTTGGQRTRRVGTWIGAGVVLIGLLGIGVWFSIHAPAAPEPRVQSQPPVSVAPPSSTPAAAASSAVVSPSVAVSSSAPSPSASVSPSVTATHGRPPPSASASGKPHERDIW
jgi:serine/threonine-protein kinase